MSLSARHHLGRTAPDVLTAVQDLVALHSSDPLTPHLALWARVPGYAREHLDDGFTEPRSLCRIHAMRRTLWVVDNDEVPTFDAAVGRSIAARERRRLLGWVDATRDDASDWLARLRDDVTEAVAASPGITTRALQEQIPGLSDRITVGSGKWKAEAPVASRLLMVLAMELDLTRGCPAGTWKSSQYTWSTAVPGPPMAPDTARAHLVRRYLERFGPVTEVDLRWWSGLKVKELRAALHEVRATQNAHGAWVLGEEGPLTAPSDTVALLPGLDPTPMGYKARDWFLGDHEAALFDSNGNVGPTVWVGNRVVGGWAVQPDARVVVRLLEDVGASAARRIDEEAARLTAWLDGTCVTPRFRTPLERTLSNPSTA